MGEDAAAPPAPAITSWGELEHMFDKVVTPSDVGKLNRLVIPKQHAERHFPLQDDDTRTGLLLRFEDREGRAWRFRYSYWHSSQSYVITKGWSRFVKDKALSPGDLVSFHRGPGGTLYIDCRRRRPPSCRTWCPFLFSHPVQPTPPLDYPNPSHPPAGHLVGPRAEEEVVLGSVPVVRRAAAAAAGKRLRLFGVNVDCPIPDSDALEDHQS